MVRSAIAVHFFALAVLAASWSAYAFGPMASPRTVTSQFDSLQYQFIGSPAAKQAAKRPAFSKVGNPAFAVTLFANPS